MSKLLQHCGFKCVLSKTASCSFVVVSMVTADVSAGVVVLRKWIAGGVCHCLVRLDGKTVLVTGANTGIGKETCRDLAGRGETIQLTCTGESQQVCPEADQAGHHGNICWRVHWALREVLLCQPL